MKIGLFDQIYWQVSPPCLSINILKKLYTFTLISIINKLSYHSLLLLNIVLNALQSSIHHITIESKQSHIFLHLTFLPILHSTLLHNILQLIDKETIPGGHFGCLGSFLRLINRMFRGEVRTTFEALSHLEVIFAFLEHDQLITLLLGIERFLLQFVL